MAIASVVMGFAAGGFEVAHFYLTSLSSIQNKLKIQLLSATKRFFKSIESRH